jgi:hypothetical protein
MNDAGKVDDMQNQLLKTLERKQNSLEERLNALEIKHADLIGRLDLALKLMRYIGIAVGASIGIDVLPMMEGM